MSYATLQYSGVVYTPLTPGHTTYALTTASGRNIPYLDPADIFVYLSSDDFLTARTLTFGTEWNFNGTGDAVVLSQPTADALIPTDSLLLRRQTPIDAPIRIFNDSEGLTANALNDLCLFLLYVVQEQGEATADADLALALARQALITAEKAEANAAAALAASAAAQATADQALSVGLDARSKANAALAASAAAQATADQALTIANAADAKATAAQAAADRAEDKADQAIADLLTIRRWPRIPTVGDIPPTGAGNDSFEVVDSTGIELFQPLTGLPAGFVGDAGLSVRIYWGSTGWTWDSYFAPDPDARYLSDTDLTRRTVTVSIPLASGATDLGVVTLPKGSVLVSAMTNSAGWLRLYTSYAAAGADAGRLRGNAPSLANGVVADPVFVAAMLMNFEPALIPFNRESPSTTTYPYRFTNDGQSNPVTITFTYLLLQP